MLLLVNHQKDKLEDFQKAGIYEVFCKDYDHRYYGQGRRTIIRRYKKHAAHAR